MGRFTTPGAPTDSGISSSNQRSSRERTTFALPVRYALSFVATVSIPLILLIVEPGAPQNGLWWDFLMGAGALGAGLMIAIPLIAPRAWVYYGGSARTFKFVLHFHRDVSYAVLALVFLHIFGLLYIDATIIEYLKLSARWSMLAASAASVLLIVVTVSSVYRVTFDLRYRTWRFWHVALSVLAMALMTFHVIDAGYYVNSPIKKAVFIALAAGPSLVSFGASGWYRFARAATHEMSERTGWSILRFPSAPAFSARLVTLLTIFWLICMFAYAIPEHGSRGDVHTEVCSGSRCD